MDVTDALVVRLRALCQRKGLTINGLSYRAGVTQSTVNDIFSGRTHNPGIATLQKLCDGLDISIRDFFDNDLFENIEQEVR